MEKKVYIDKDNKNELAEKIYKLRRRGLTFKEVGLETGLSLSVVYRIYNETLDKKGAVDFDKSKLVLKEKIYQLKKEGLTFEKISNQMNIPMSKAIRLYEQVLEDKEEIKLTNLDEKIYKLRTKGLSYNQIVEKLTEEGIDTTYYIVRTKCKKIFKIKNENEPKIERTLTVKRTEKSKKYDEEIYSLREQGNTFLEISKILADKGIKMSRVRVHERYIRAKKITNQQLINGIMNLTTTRNATAEQIEKIAEIYGVDLDNVFEEYLEER